MRAHFTRPVTDQQGDLLPNVQVSVYEPATTDLIPDIVYSTDTGTNVLNNPFVSDTGIIDIYLDNPKRIRLGIIQGSLPVQYYEDVDVLAAGSDSLHSGAGTDSLMIGPAASAPGNSSVALGSGSSSGGMQATAVGNGANALGDQSIALGTGTAQGIGSIGIGNGATATADGGIGIGNGATAGMADSTALGDGATSNYAHSTAIGPGAVTTGANQIMIGTATDHAELPQGSFLVMTSSGGFRYQITVGDDGSLTTTAI